MRHGHGECRLWVRGCSGGVGIHHSCCVGDGPADHPSHAMSMWVTSMGPSPCTQPYAQALCWGELQLTISTAEKQQKQEGKRHRVPLAAQVQALRPKVGSVSQTPVLQDTADQPFQSLGD